MRARLHVRGSRFGFFSRGNARSLRRARDAAAAARDAGRARPADGRRPFDWRGRGPRDRAVRKRRCQRAGGASRDVASRSIRRLIEQARVGGRLTPGPYVDRPITVGDASLKLRRHVLAFFQGNRYLLSDLVRHVTDRVPIGAPLARILYAGVGLFSVAAAVRCAARAVPPSRATRRRSAISSCKRRGCRSEADDVPCVVRGFWRAWRSRSRRGRPWKSANRAARRHRSRDRRSAEDRDVASRRSPVVLRMKAAAPHLRLVRRRHARPRRAQDRRRRLRHRPRRRLRHVPEHAARRDGRRLRPT